MREQAPMVCVEVASGQGELLVGQHRDDNLMDPADEGHGADGAFTGEEKDDAYLFPATATLLGVATGGLLAAGLIGAGLAWAAGGKRHKNDHHRSMTRESRAR